jgi:hypothetical protein
VEENMNDHEIEIDGTWYPTEIGVERLKADITLLRKDIEEQCRLLGAGGEREAKLMTDLAVRDAVIKELRVALVEAAIPLEALYMLRETDLLDDYSNAEIENGVETIRRALAATSDMDSMDTKNDASK